MRALNEKIPHQKEKGVSGQQMTETFYRTGIHKVDHTRFGGIILPSDFDMRHASRNIASRIENDRKFDERCRQNILNQKKDRRQI